MQEFVIGIANQFGYAGIFFLVALENIFPPIPSEIILTFGGFMTTYTEMKALWVIIFATCGSILGALILYSLGYWLSADRIDSWIGRGFGRRLKFRQGDVTRAAEWFAEKGTSTVFFCRCIPILRSLISIPAGIAKMPIIKFLLLTTAGSLIWNTALVTFGSIAGDSWRTIIKFMGTYSALTVLILFIQATVFFVFFYKRRNKKK